MSEWLVFYICADDSVHIPTLVIFRQLKFCMCLILIKHLLINRESAALGRGD